MAISGLTFNISQKFVQIETNNKSTAKLVNNKFEGTIEKLCYDHNLLYVYYEFIRNLKAN